jgi:GH3 auxin-responsive promoter
MNNAYKLIEEGRKDELWAKYCGFLSLSRNEFKDIQKRLMLEQIALLGPSKIGRSFMGGKTPASLEEYRQITPLTTYADYLEILEEKKEEDLPAKPYTWARTSGYSSDHGPKWIPYTKAMYDHLSDAVIGSMILSSCSQPGNVRLERGDKFLMATAPPPYISGYISRSTKENLEARFLPSLEEGEKMPYGERVATGFKLAMRDGLDYFMGLSVVLARMGEQFEQQSSNTKPSKDLLNPATLWRLLKAVVISKIQKRNILPKDIWHLKGIMSGGTDIEVYKERIEHFWGKKPLEGYACTEAGNMAMQGWNFKGMVFVPDISFLEFIPFEEGRRNKDDPAFHPKTLLYDELDLGIYELVISSFYGGALVRYRVGDLFEVIANGDEETGSDLPQMKFYSRKDDLIDLGSFLRLTERDIWKTIDATGLEYNDWVARKHTAESYPTLHIYIELASSASIPEEKVQEMIRQSFSARISEYNDMKEMLRVEPVVVTLLPRGSFAAYIKSKTEAGSDLGHMKPPHMKPSDDVLMKLIGAPKESKQ